MEVIGKIKVINPVQEVSASFKKREFVVSTDEQYPQHILIEFNQDKCALLDNYKVDEIVKVSINLRGREWINQQGDAKYFNTIQAWKIEAKSEQPVTDIKVNKPIFETIDPINLSSAKEDDLPF